MEDASPSIVFGNAYRAGASRRGWFLGHFMGAGDPHFTEAVEVKWAIHAAGDHRSDWSTNQTATTLSVLIHGQFRLFFPDEEVLLTTEGDYVLWLPGVAHTWTAESASTVLTVRYPSTVGDILE